MNVVPSSLTKRPSWIGMEGVYTLWGGRAEWAGAIDHSLDDGAVRTLDRAHSARAVGIDLAAPGATRIQRTSRHRMAAISRDLLRFCSHAIRSPGDDRSHRPH